MNYSRYAIMILLALMLMTANLLAQSAEEIEKMSQAMPAVAPASPAKPRTVLVINLCNGYKHDSIPFWNKALEIMGRKTKAFTTVVAEDLTVLQPEKLAAFDAICFNNTTQLYFTTAQQRALLDFVRGGKGLIGIHAAADNFYEWQEAAALMGNQFSGHPWNIGGIWAYKVDDPNHPLTRMFKNQRFKFNDEIYRTDLPYYSRDKQRVLISLDMADPDTAGVKDLKPSDQDTGITWIKSYGQGRVFYCSWGHDPGLTWNPEVLAHYLAGIQFALGDLPADTTPLPNAEVNAFWQKQLEETLDKVRLATLTDDQPLVRQLHDLIARFYQQPAELLKVEQKLLGVLTSDCPLPTQQNLCRELSVVGTAASVPVLVTMLEQPETADMARYALERIPTPQVGDRLIALLGKAPESIQIGIITTLGVRASSATVPVLEPYLKSYHPLLTPAAVYALGRIATPEAESLLIEYRPILPADNLYLVYDALLQIAQTAGQRGEQPRAVSRYRDFFQEGNPAHVRVAALKGLIDAAPSEMAKLLTTALQDGEVQVKTTAIGEICRRQNPALVESLSQSAASLTPALQVTMLTAIAEHRLMTGQKIAISLLPSGDRSVRQAAIAALGKVGDGAVAALLAKTAAGAEDRTERELAQQALYNLPGADVDAVMVRGITDKPEGQPKLGAEWIRAAGERRIVAAVTPLLALASSENNLLRRESLRTLQELAGPEHLPRLVEILVSKPDAASEKTVVAVAQKTEPRLGCARPVTAAMKSLQDPVVLGSLLRVLGRIGDPESLTMITQYAQSENADLRAAALDAMFDWSGPELKDRMRQMAQTSTNASEQILALRAYMRLLIQSEEESCAQKVATLREMLPVIKAPSETVLLLATLGHFDCQEALDMATEYAAQEEFRREAQAAIISICGTFAGYDYLRAYALLDDLKNTAASDPLKQQSWMTQDKIRTFNNALVQWQVSEFYADNKTPRNELLKTPFVPETNPQQASWQRLPSFPNPGRLWQLEPQKYFGFNREGVAYLRCQVWSDQGQEARLGLGTSGGMKVWIQGKPIHTSLLDRPMRANQDWITIHLESGWNTIMIKTLPGKESWLLSAQLYNSNASPLNLKVSNAF